MDGDGDHTAWCADCMRHKPHNIIYNKIVCPEGKTNVFMMLVLAFCSLLSVVRARSCAFSFLSAIYEDFLFYVNYYLPATELVKHT